MSIFCFIYVNNKYTSLDLHKTFDFLKMKENGKFVFVIVFTHKRTDSQVAKARFKKIKDKKTRRLSQKVWKLQKIDKKLMLPVYYLKSL